LISSTIARAARSAPRFVVVSIIGAPFFLTANRRIHMRMIWSFSE
jgi:hypothetical protein